MLRDCNHNNGLIRTILYYFTVYSKVDVFLYKLQKYCVLALLHNLKLTINSENNTESHCTLQNQRSEAEIIPQVLLHILTSTYRGCNETGYPTPQSLSLADSY